MRNERYDLARAFVGLAVAASAFGCGGAASHPPKGTGAPSEDAGGPFVEAPHSPLPRVVFNGGPLLSAPKIVTVTFPGDENADALETFGDAITTSSWWNEVTSSLCDGAGTCVGKGTSGGHVRLAAAPAATYTDATDGSKSSFQLFMASLIGQGTLPAPDASTLYVFYLPASSVITLTESATQIGMSCNQFQAYHNAIIQPGATPIAYAIVQECPPTNGLAPLDALTFSASHEIVEAASDPVQKTLGFYLDLDDTSVLGWNLLAGGEIADLCVDITGLRADRTTSDGYVLQRIWSNANAAKGIDPCIPSRPASVGAPSAYFNVAPAGSSSYIVLKVGGETSFELDAFSTEAMEPWTVEAIDWATAQGQVKAPLLTFSMNGGENGGTTTVNNGDKITVKISLNADPNQLKGAEGVFLSVAGSLKAPTAAHVWPILVVTPDGNGGGS